MEEAEKEVTKLEREIGNFENTYIARVDAWKRNVADVVAPLNRNFSAYMNALRFRGEVTMVEKDTIDQYEVWFDAKMLRC